MVPLLFVTIACGAVSGFHGIVSSGTTSKQLDRETDAKFVGYLGAVGEGALALVTIVAVSGAALAATPAAWHAIYDEYGSAGASTFVLGGAQLIRDGWGLPLDVATAMLATMVVLFAATTMDTGIRLQRYIIQEWGEIYSLPALRSGVIATLVAIACCMLLAFGAGGGSGAGGLTIWPLFGSTNQILAALTLLVISVMLIKLGRPARYTLVPMIFVLVTSAWAAILKLIEWYQAGDWLLVTIDIVVLVISVLVILEAASAVFRHRRTAALSGGMS
jgi:carbon starvation protein